MTVPEYARVNRAHWDDAAHRWVEAGRRRWTQDEPTWGMWGVPDDQAPLLPANLTGLEVVELGCGTGYVSAWAARRGARRVVGVDNSERQLETARRLCDEFDQDAITWIHGLAEDVPEPDDAFDVAVSEYGAAIWSEPAAWLREARRLLRTGGRLAFLGSHPLTHVCAPLDGSLPVVRELLRPWRDVARLDWRDAVDEPGGIEFCPTLGDWFRHFRDTGFVVVDYRELWPPDGVEGAPFAVTADWAERWPSEHAFWLRAV